MSLDAALKRRIAEDGPIPLETFMAEAVDAYYARGAAFGREGDFVTAPEVCQVFGEIIGLWAAVVWQSMGCPAPVRLVELGPGRGVLMADALRAAAKVPPFLAAIDLHLVERSPVLRQAQKAALGERPCRWHGDLSQIPDGPAIVIANEFFDALPIRQVERTPDGWRRRDVGLDDAGAFVFVAGPQMPPPDFADAPVGTIVEDSPACAAVAEALGRRLATQGGVALVFDYGYETSAPGDTLQAVARHTFAPPLERPGEVDLTAHVDFARLRTAAEAAGARVLGPVGQGRFLTLLGAEQRARALTKVATPEQAVRISSGVHRLIHPAEMGTLFKTTTIFHPGLPPPPGFEGFA